MEKVAPGRFTAQHDEPFVVYLLGMRINRLFAFSKWLSVARAIRPMMRTLSENPEKGYLGGRYFYYWREAGMIQYWRSYEDMERFARDPEDPHPGPWRRFNETVSADGSVGIWHEAFLVERGRYETIYGNMPPFGLAQATRAVPAVGRFDTAARRMGRESPPAVSSPPQPGTAQTR